MTDSTLGEFLFLIRAEFLEIPDLQLTQGQIEHLWGIDAAIAGAILSSLVEAHFLDENAGRRVFPQSLRLTGGDPRESFFGNAAGRQGGALRPAPQLACRCAALRTRAGADKPS